MTATLTRKHRWPSSGKHVCEAMRCGDGGGSGIGKAIAKDLLTLGCNVVIAARKEERLIEAMRSSGAAAPAAEIVTTAATSARRSRCVD